MMITMTTRTNNRVNPRKSTSLSLRLSPKTLTVLFVIDRLCCIKRHHFHCCTTKTIYLYPLVQAVTFLLAPVQHAKRRKNGLLRFRSRRRKLFCSVPYSGRDISFRYSTESFRRSWL